MKKAIIFAAALAIPTSALPQDTIDCEVEAWNKAMKVSIPYLTSATTCEMGRIVYRLFDADTEEFLASGSSYFDGFAFDGYPSLKSWPENVTMKYVIYNR